METVNKEQETSTTKAGVSFNPLLSAVSFNLIWDADITVENDFRSYLLERPIYDMKCNQCLTFIGAYHTPEDCKDNFCPNCGNAIRNDR